MRRVFVGLDATGAAKQRNLPSRSQEIDLGIPPRISDLHGVTIGSRARALKGDPPAIRCQHIHLTFKVQAQGINRR